MNNQHEARLANLEPTQRAICLSTYESQKKSTAVYALLALFTGGIGGHQFYLGNTLAGILSVLFFWTLIPAICALIELVLCHWIVSGHNRKIMAKQLNLMGV